MRILSGSIFIIAVVLTVFQAADIQAQEKRTFYFMISPHFDFAVSPEEFTDYYSTGFGLGAGLEFPVSPQWSIVGLVDVKLFSPAEGTIRDWWTDPGEYPNATDITVEEGSLTAVSFALQGKGALRQETTRTYPYVRGGFGLTIAGADEVLVKWYDTGLGENREEWVAGVSDETNVSVIFGFGLEHRTGASNMALFGDIGLHMIFQEDVNPTVASITVGIKF